MSNELSSKSEQIALYQLFGNGRVVDLMPQLIQAGYNPVSIATVVDRRQTASEEVRLNWENIYFFTGDSSTTDKTGGTILTLDSPFLIKLTSEHTDKLIDGALPLTRGQKNELKGDKRHSLYLTPAQVEKADGKGYLIQGGKVVAANTVVARAWDHILRGGNVREYAQFVADTSKSDDVMRWYFDRSKPETPRLRSLVINSTYDDSSVLTYDNLGSNYGRLAGVARQRRPAHRSREKKFLNQESIDV